MSELPPADRAQYVQDIFTRIAPRYDLMNRLMTGGQDVHWRQEVIHRAQLSPGSVLLDLGAGTGDLAREALRQCPQCQPTAADFTLAMMRAGQPLSPPIPRWSAADALQLPFAAESFDAIVSGYLMRNVTHLGQALAEQYRVLRTGGRIVVLDTTRPRRNLLSPLIHIHMHIIIPFLGWLLTRQRDAYTYLPDSTENFLCAEDLAQQMKLAGFKEVGFKRLMFGTMAIHWGKK